MEQRLVCFVGYVERMLMNNGGTEVVRQMKRRSTKPVQPIYRDFKGDVIDFRLIGDVSGWRAVAV